MVEGLGRGAGKNGWGDELERRTGERDSDCGEGLGRGTGWRDWGEGLGEGAEPDESRTNAKERLWVERLYT